MNVIMYHIVIKKRILNFVENFMLVLSIEDIVFCCKISNANEMPEW